VASCIYGGVNRPQMCQGIDTGREAVVVLHCVLHRKPRALGRTRPLVRPLVVPLPRVVCEPPLAGSRLCCEVPVLANFFGVGLEPVDGFSTKVVLVVINVLSASISPGSLDGRDVAASPSFSFTLRKESAIGPSGKSTQNAFMLSPYKKLAKSSLNRAKLSCMSWKCIMLASRSVTASASSAKAGSKALSGNGSPPPLMLRCADSRKDERDEGRSGVVGREREVERGLRASSGLGPDIVVGCWLRCTPSR